MARDSVKFSSGGKLTPLGKAVKNMTRRMQRQRKRLGATVDTKSIRNQIRKMIDFDGRSEGSVAETLNKIRDNRLFEMFVDKNTGTIETNISEVRISVKDMLIHHLNLDDERVGYLENDLLKQFIYDLELDYADDLDNVLQSNAKSINDALNTVIWGYLDKGITQGLDTALIRLYERVMGEISFNRQMSIREGVENYEYRQAYGTGRYNTDETEF